MFAQYFGHYLLNHGLVSVSDLERAMLAAKETRVKLGVLAIDNGLMNSEQVEEVHQAQTRMDKRFGEIAEELGYLTSAQIDELLSMQQTAHLALGQAMVELELMNYDTFANALHDYKAAHRLTDEQFKKITHGDIEVLLETVLLKDELADNAAWSNYIQLFAKNCVRFLSGDIRLEHHQSGGNEANEWFIYQPMLNTASNVARRTALAGTKAAFLELASDFAQEKVTDIEMMEAAVGEFLNLHNGIYLVNASNSGVELDLKPQTFARGLTAEEAGFHSTDKAVIRIVSPRYEVDLIIENLADLN